MSSRIRAANPTRRSTVPAGPAASKSPFAIAAPSWKHTTASSTSPVGGTAPEALFARETLRAPYDHTPENTDTSLTNDPDTRAASGRPRSSHGLTAGAAVLLAHAAASIHIAARTTSTTATPLVARTNATRPLGVTPRAAPPTPCRGWRAGPLGTGGRRRPSKAPRPR